MAAAASKLLRPMTVPAWQRLICSASTSREDRPSMSASSSAYSSSIASSIMPAFEKTSARQRRPTMPPYSSMMSAPRISPVRGFTKLGPYPENGGEGEAVQRSTLYLTSPASHSASSGCTLTTTALVNPRGSKAWFHFSTPSLMMGRNSSGVVFSIHHVMGFTGSDMAAEGSFFSRRQR